MSVQPRRIASAAQLMLHRRHNFTRTRVRTRSIKHFTLFSFLSFSFGLAAAQGASSKEPPKCLVRGQVVHEPGGQPLKKVTVKLNPEDKENGTTYKAMSDLEGRFKFEKIEAGDYTLTIDRNGFLETGKQKGVHKLNLRPGDEVKDVVLRMQPSAVINGKILDNDGDPLPGVSITVRKPGTSSPQRGIVSTGYTDDLGEYRIGNLRPGRYLIEANLIDYSFEPEATVKMADETRETAPYTTYYPGGTDKSQAATIELRAGDEVAINLTLTYGPAYRVRGTLVGMPDLAGADANMVLRPKDQGPWGPSQFAATVKRDGSFEIPKLLPGEYRAILYKLDGTDFHIYQAAQVVVVRDSDVDNLRLSPESDADVHGQFRTEHGEKLNWALFTFTLDSGEKEPEYDMNWPGPSTRGQLRADGSFDIKKVPPGKYRVTLNSDTSAQAFYIKSVSLGSKDVADSGFSVSGGSWSLDVVLSSESATLEGAVIDSKDRPVADAVVIAVPDAEHRRRHDLFKKTLSDQNGHFVLQGLRPGEYSALAFEELDDDYRDPDFLQPFEDKAVRVRVDKGEHKPLALKVIATE